MSAQLQHTSSKDDFMAKMAEFTLGSDDNLDLRLELRDPPKLELKDPAKAAPKIRLPSFGPDDFANLGSSFLRTESPLRSSSITAVQLANSQVQAQSFTQPSPKPSSHSGDSYLSSITSTGRSGGGRSLTQGSYLTSTKTPKSTRSEGAINLGTHTDTSAAAGPMAAAETSGGDSYLASILGGVSPATTTAIADDAPAECMCVKCKGKPSANPTHCDSPVNCMCYKCQKQRRRDALRSGVAAVPVELRTRQHQDENQNQIQPNDPTWHSPPSRAFSDTTNDPTWHGPPSRAFSDTTNDHSQPTSLPPEHQHTRGRSFYDRVRGADEAQDLSLLEDGDVLRFRDNEGVEGGALTEPIRRLRDMMDRQREIDGISVRSGPADDIRAGPTLRMGTSAIASAPNTTKAAQRLSLTGGKPVQQPGKKKVLTASYRTGGTHSHLTLYHTMKMKSKKERMMAYERAFRDCTNAQTGLWEWSKKQKEKGPPLVVLEYKPNTRVFHHKRPLFRPAKSARLASSGHKRIGSKSDSEDAWSRDSFGAPSPARSRSSQDSNEVAKSNKRASQISLSPILGPSKLSAEHHLPEEDTATDQHIKNLRTKNPSFRRAHSSPSEKPKPYAHIDQPLRPGTRLPDGHERSKSQSTNAFEAHNGLASSRQNSAPASVTSLHDGTDTQQRTQQDIMAMLDLLDWDAAAGPSPSNSSAAVGNKTGNTLERDGRSNEAAPGRANAIQPAESTSTSRFVAMAAKTGVSNATPHPAGAHARESFGPMPVHTVSSIYGIRVQPVTIPEPKVVKVVNRSSSSLNSVYSYPPSPPSPSPPSPSPPSPSPLSPSLSSPSPPSPSPPSPTPEVASFVQTTTMSPSSSLSMSHSLALPGEEEERTPLPSKRISTYRKPTAAEVELSRSTGLTAAGPALAPAKTPTPTPAPAPVKDKAPVKAKVPATSAPSNPPAPATPSVPATSSAPVTSSTPAISAPVASPTGSPASTASPVPTASPAPAAPPAPATIPVLAVSPMQSPTPSSDPTPAPAVTAPTTPVSTTPSVRSRALSAAAPPATLSRRSRALSVAAPSVPSSHSRTLSEAVPSLPSSGHNRARSEVAPTTASETSTQPISKIAALKAQLAPPPPPPPAAAPGTSKIAALKAQLNAAPPPKEVAPPTTSKIAAMVADLTALPPQSVRRPPINTSPSTSTLALQRKGQASSTPALPKPTSTPVSPKPTSTPTSPKLNPASEVTEVPSTLTTKPLSTAAKTAPKTATTTTTTTATTKTPPPKTTTSTPKTTTSTPKTTTSTPKTITSTPKTTTSTPKTTTPSLPKTTTTPPLPKTTTTPPKTATATTTPPPKITTTPAAPTTAAKIRGAPKATTASTSNSHKKPMTATTIRLPPKTPKVTTPAPKESETTEEKSADDVPTSPNGKAVPKSAKPTLSVSPPSSTTQRPSSTSRRTPSSSPLKAGSQSALSPSSSTSTTSTSSTSGKSSRPASVSLNASTSTSARAKKVMKSTLDKGLDDLCAVLPHVDRETLKSYLDRANGDYVAAIGLCMTAVKAGKL